MELFCRTRKLFLFPEKLLWRTRFAERFPKKLFAGLNKYFNQQFQTNNSAGKGAGFQGIFFLNMVMSTISQGMVAKSTAFAQKKWEGGIFSKLHEPQACAQCDQFF